LTTTGPDRDPNHANHVVIAEFRANAGRVGGYFANTSLLLLTTTGARTGISRTRPLTYLRGGDRYVVVAANAGAPQHPAWYHNLASQPDVVIEVGETTLTATAVVLSGAERDALLRRFESEHPISAGYHPRTDRKVPVVALYPHHRRQPDSRPEPTAPERSAVSTFG
jgi:deazaflavin-dependent oxidoreductase (nitroreductase family)